MSSTIDKAVSIKCEGARTLQLEEIHILQGNLKDLSEENYNKLKQEILHHGYSEPIAVWFHEDKWNCLSGTQRVRVLLGLKAEGYFIPPLPVSIIYADDLKQALEKILALASQYGVVTDTGLYEFMNMGGIDVSFLENVRMPEVNVEKWIESYGDTNFQAGTIEEQGKLDVLSPIMCKCPKCQEEFNARENPVEN